MTISVSDGGKTSNKKNEKLKQTGSKGGNVERKNKSTKKLRLFYTEVRVKENTYKMSTKETQIVPLMYFVEFQY